MKSARRRRLHGYRRTVLGNRRGHAADAKPEEIEMLLKDKVAVIYGAAGAIGGSVASTFAREGARLFLTGRTLKSVTDIAK
jgi:FlaA1/EpsC-like NDP-sugar epimerase